jgi:hypothetical protein
MSIENFDEVKSYFESNKDNEDVKNYIEGFLTPDRVESFLVSDLGKKILQPKLDSYATKAISSHDEKFKTNELPKLINEEVKKRYPDKDEKDIRLESVMAELEKMKKENLMKEIKNQAILMLDEKKLPKDVLNFIVSDDLEKTKANIETFGNVFNPYIQSAVEERIRIGSYTPPKNNDSTTKNPWSKEHFNLTEQGRLMTENPVLASQFMAQANK